SVQVQEYRVMRVRSAERDAATAFRGDHAGLDSETALRAGHPLLIHRETEGDRLDVWPVQTRPGTRPPMDLRGAGVLRHGRHSLLGGRDDRAANVVVEVLPDPGDIGTDRDAQGAQFLGRADPRAQQYPRGID